MKYNAFLYTGLEIHLFFMAWLTFQSELHSNRKHEKISDKNYDFLDLVGFETKCSNWTNVSSQSF